MQGLDYKKGPKAFHSKRFLNKKISFALKNIIKLDVVTLK